MTDGRYNGKRRQIKKIRMLNVIKRNKSKKVKIYKR